MDTKSTSRKYSQALKTLAVIALVIVSFLGVIAASFIIYDHIYSDYEITIDTNSTLTAGYALLIIAVLLVIYLIGVTGQTHKNSEVTYHWLDSIPVEILASLWILLYTLTIFVLQNLKLHQSQMLHIGNLYFNIPLVYSALLLTTLGIISITMLLSVVRSLKAKRFWQRFLIYKIVAGILGIFSIRRWSKTFKPSVFIYLVIYGLLNGFAFAWLVSGQSTLSLLGLFGLVALNVVAIYLVNRQLSSLKYLVDYTHDIAHSDATDTLDESRITPLFREFSSDLQTVNSGLTVAVEHAVNNERMRSELITNVTHDLKNPLTSIISYTDLLAKEPLDSDDAKQYIGVISDKSNRLKELIDHLVEASKVASGVAEIKREDVDLVAFAQQLQGEYHEAFAKNKLDFIIQTSLESAVVQTDSTYYTRIMDNLFSNILKYAMPGTRVYCSIEQQDGYQICLKNISSQPLDVSETELMERFVRGDQARSSEGNGLGLSIAKSLAVALGAELTIRLDGDLFKACLHHLAQ